MTTNTLPQVGTIIADQSFDEDSAVSFTLPADAFTDLDGDPLTLSAALADGSTLPSWLSFDPSTGTFSGTPPQDYNGTLSIKVSASDGTADPVLQVFDLMIEPVNDAPVVGTIIADQHFDEDTAVDFTVPGDAFIDPDGDALYYAALQVSDGNGNTNIIALPSWLNFNQITGIFSGTPPQDFHGSYDIRVWASDGNGDGPAPHQTFTLVIDPVNDDPEAGTALADQSFDEDSSFSFTIPSDAFIDVDGDTLYYEPWQREQVSGGPFPLILYSQLPDWLRFDADTGTFFGDPPQDYNGSIVIAVRADDRNGGDYAEQLFTLTIDPVNDDPEVRTIIADRLLDQGTDVSFTIPDDAFTDVDDDALTYDATVVDGDWPEWLEFDPETGTFTGTPDPGWSGTLRIVVTASDGQAGSTPAAQEFELLVRDPNQVIVGTDEDDTLIGGTGHDTFYGGAGNDTMYGGMGDDTFYVDDLGDTVVENQDEGTDHVISSVTYALWEHSQWVENLTLTGTTDIDGTGNARANTIIGNSGNNNLYGNWGDDILIGGAGNDDMYGGIGNDTFYVDDLEDRVFEYEDEGTDHVISSVSFALWEHSQYLENLTLTGTENIDGTGNARANTIIGNSGNNNLYGNWGDDILIGGVGNDTMYGGMGDDTFYVDDLGDKVVEYQDEGTDHVISSVSFKLWEHSQYLENLTLTGTEDIDGHGNARANTIIGNSGDNTLNGGWGDDTLIGGAGNDTFLDLTGRDYMEGGEGDDTYHVNGVGDKVVEYENEGTDHVISSVSFKLWEHSQYLENLTLTGADDIDASGNARANTITGNAGNNTVSSGLGDDTLIGGSGSDILTGGTGSDTFVFNFGDTGHDTITDFTAGAGSEDVMEFDAALFATYDALLAAMTDDGTNTVITIDADTTITLEGVTVADLHQDDFNFV